MIRRLSKWCCFRSIRLIKPLGSCRKTFIRKHFRLNRLERGFGGNICLLEAWIQEKSPLTPLFGSMSGYRMKNGEDLWRDIRQGLQGQLPG